ncbi:MAG: hypothetical protein GX172_01000, partial [Clostridiales bacterium]|nr:hypothetical protein [Clostridiales bacterium]
VEALNNGGSIEAISTLEVREQIGRFKYVKEADVDREFDKIMKQLHQQMQETIVMEEM